MKTIRRCIPRASSGAPCGILLQESAFQKRPPGVCSVHMVRALPHPQIALRTGLTMLENL